MKSFAERNLVIIGALTALVIVVITVGLFNWNRLPFVHAGTTYTAYFEELGGLETDTAVQVSGVSAGQVKGIKLDANGVLVTFTVDSNIRLGDRTEAAIVTKSLLGNKVLEITPRGNDRLKGSIPLDRTTSPYQLPDAIGDLTATISGLNTDQLSNSLQTLSETLKDTPGQLKVAVDGIARFSQTVNQRDEQLRGLLANARKATKVLGDRTGQIVQLVHDTNSLLATLRTQSRALSQISTNLSALAQQIKGFIAEHRADLKPALDKLNDVLTIVDNHKAEVQQSIKGLNTYAMSFGESLNSGPFFKAYLANLLPGQFVQPMVDAAFSDLGLDPNTQLPSQISDPQVGQPGTPALPLPFPRTGQGGTPNMTLPDAITGNPGDQQCGPVPLPGPGCYPYREPAPAPPPGGPPPGPPASSGADSLPPTPTPVFVVPSENPGPTTPEPVPNGGGQ